MGFPSGPAAARAVANANLSGEKAVRSCEPRTRCRDPFQQLEDHLEEFLTTIERSEIDRRWRPQRGERSESKDTEGKNMDISLSFDSLAPARLALRANLRWSISKAPAFSIVVKPTAGFRCCSRGRCGCRIRFCRSRSSGRLARFRRRPRGGCRVGSRWSGSRGRRGRSRGGCAA